MTSLSVASSQCKNGLWSETWAERPDMGSKRGQDRICTYRSRTAIDAAFSKTVIVLDMVNCLANVAEIENVFQGIRADKVWLCWQHFG